MKTAALFLVMFGCVAASAATQKRAAGQRSAVGTAERTVTLDVREEDAREILASLQQQCGIRNLIVDRDVQGKGTFIFRGVPCSTATRVVFGSLGLDAMSYGNGTLRVGAGQR